MILFPLLLVTIALVILGTRYEQQAQKAFRTSASPPGEWVDLGGYRLHLFSQGKRRPGQPTIVLVSGHGDWSRCWRDVQLEIARFGRVVSYDRPGYGWSDNSPHPRTPENMASDLHELLRRAGEFGPYLLIGHSMGAALSRLFHRRYPGEVVGMVWVDPAHENMEAFLPHWRYGFSRALPFLLRIGALLAQVGLVRRFGTRLLLANYPVGSEPSERFFLLEQTVTTQFFRELLGDTLMLTNAGPWGGLPVPLGDLPVISIEAQYSKKKPFWMTKNHWTQFIAGWRAMQADLHILTTRFQNWRVESGHNVMNEQPQIVVRAVQDMLDQITNPLP